MQYSSFSLLTYHYVKKQKLRIKNSSAVYANFLQNSTQIEAKIGRHWKKPNMWFDGAKEVFRQTESQQKFGPKMIERNRDLARGRKEAIRLQQTDNYYLCSGLYRRMCYYIFFMPETLGIGFLNVTEFYIVLKSPERPLKNKWHARTKRPILWKPSN